MGEPEVVEIAQLDMGTEPVDNAAAVASIPADEKICGFTISKTKSDLKWSSFDVVTTQRTLHVSDGTVGAEQFNAFCDDVRAMFQTAEGQVVLGKMKALLRLRPLVIQTSVTEAPAE